MYLYICNDKQTNFKTVYNSKLNSATFYSILIHIMKGTGNINTTYFTWRIRSHQCVANNVALIPSRWL